MARDEEPVLELGEGFGGEEVVVLVDGRPAWQGTARTDWSIGLAEVVRLPPGSALEVRAAGASARTALGPGSRVRADRARSGALDLGPAPDGPLM